MHGPYICFLNKTFSLLVLLSGGFLYAGAGLFLSIFLGFQFTFRLKGGRQHGVSWLLALQTTAACSTFTSTANLLENTICSINRKNSLQYIASFGDPGGIRTHGLSLRRRKQGFPPIPLECPQTLAITAFLTNSIVPVSSKKHLFYPSAIRQRLDKLIGGGRTFSHSVRQN